jgi:hypothetical protein
VQNINAAFSKVFVFPNPSWIASLSLQTVVSFPSLLVHVLDLFQCLCTTVQLEPRGEEHGW